jgi:GH24 family phage-related lysozyme (muramidase)
MRLSKEGRTELIASEGYKAQVYDDANGRIVSSYDQVSGYPTIGIGHLITDKERKKFAKYLGGGKEMSESQVSRLLSYDIKRFTDHLNKELNIDVTQPMFDALTAYAFNIGVNSNFLKRTIEKINSKDFSSAASIILSGPTTSKGVVLDGLVRRRLKEAEQFLSGGLPTIIKSVANNFKQVGPYGWLLFFYGVGAYVVHKRSK